VAAGSQQAGQAIESMGRIVVQIEKVGQLVGEISAGSSQQAQGISEIGSAVSQLDEVTQQNAALVEQSAAAAESLRNQAAQLAALVARFELG
jgi:methyl-accepting chemotaxis protein